jgi:hypothetical protein
MDHVHRPSRKHRFEGLEGDAASPLCCERFRTPGVGVRDGSQVSQRSTVDEARVVKRHASATDEADT